MSLSNNTESIEIEELPFTTDEFEDLAESVYDLIEEYMMDNVLNMSKPNFKDTIIDDVTHVIFQQLDDADVYDNYDVLRNFVEDQLEIWFTSFLYKCPERHLPHDLGNILVDYFGQDEEFAMEFITQKLMVINEKDSANPPQRTPEWYKRRYDMLTASNVYQALGSEAQKNRLIYEKCKPLDTTIVESKWISTEGSLHWGVKYEPLTVLMYEKMTGAKIGNFGCIQHSEYPFLGASPDGIVINKESPLYGRLVEIKNIYNREMDGVPSEAYWVQMQLQMQCCELEACDFVETRFEEYESEDAYKTDTNDREKVRGIILQFIPRDSLSNIPKYEYFIADGRSMEEWVEEKKAENPEYVIFKTHYWYLDEICMTTILRNELWFQTAIIEFKSIWDTIQKERISGYEHRSSKKRSPSIDINVIKEGSETSAVSVVPTCFIKLSKEAVNED
jgi:putative phage-type endonuclease